MHDNVNQVGTYSVDQNASLKDLILNFKKWIVYLSSKWFLILIFGVLGALLGLAYAYNKTPSFIATTSFVLDGGNKRGALGAYTGLASTFGIDIGGGGGLFEGENILELYKSRNMISKTLLTEVEFNGKKQLLIDRYIQFKKIREKWQKKKPTMVVNFSTSNHFSTSAMQRTHDSIMSQIVNKINKDNLVVKKIDKKLNIINIIVKSEDELFSKAFNENLVQRVNSFYLDTKMKRNFENVEILQIKTDSVKNVMRGAIYSGASVADATPNQNLTRMTQREAPIQSAKINALISQEALSMLMQNLEMSKISLLKETPLIEIVDGPILPLPVQAASRLIFGVLGFLLIASMVVFFLVALKTVKDALHS